LHYEIVHIVIKNQVMKKSVNLVLVSLLLLLSSCEAIQGIFKAGVYTGIIAVVLVVGVIIWILAKLSR
jgi:hypothetical protein